jgi:Protein of unknown function (DUF4231)
MAGGGDAEMEQAVSGELPYDACNRVIEVTRRKADKHERLAKRGTLAIIVSTASIPVVLVISTQWFAFGLGKLVPAALAALGTVIAGWIQLQAPHDRWKLYRGYQRVLEAERLKYENRIDPYHGEDRDGVLVDRLTKAELAMHDEWSGLVPRSADAAAAVARRPS